MTNSGLNLESWISERLFNSVPMSIAVIDREFNIIAANTAFETMFGEWKLKKCHAVYKNSNSKCQICAGSDAFFDGKPRANEEVGYSKDGNLTRYIKYTIPIEDDNGKIPYLIEMSTDITEYDRMKKELQLLFDQVPCNITILNRNLEIVRANQKVYEDFGDVKGQKCHCVYKGKEFKCTNCPVQKTFKDGTIHTGRSQVTNNKGEVINFLVTSAPMDTTDGKVNLVMELAIDITENLKLQDELSIAHSFLENMIDASIDGIVAINNQGEVTIFNQSARKIMKHTEDQVINKDILENILPSGFMSQVNAGPGHVYLPDSTIKSPSGNIIPVRLAGVKLMSNNNYIGMAFFMQDLTRIKLLETANLEAERLAAVGQTVAGLAHGIKNLIAGLEGGMYLLNTGINLSKSDRIVQGWDILDRNIGRVSSFVKAFLAFSRGSIISAEEVNPYSIAKEVVDLYKIKAEQSGIDLCCVIVGKVKKAYLDKEGIHESLTNLVGNAIDACLMSEKQKKYSVKLRVKDMDESIIFEVTDDGCGMDYEVKKKIFTNFFTSKGLGGTGIGLLQTRKIIQEHGGVIDVESELGKGSTFRITLPRNKLPLPEEIAKDEG